MAATVGILIAIALCILPASPAGAAPGMPLGRGPQVPVNPEVDPDRSRDHAEDILDGDEYQEPSRADRSVPDRVREWIADRIPDIDIGGDGRSSSAARLFAYALIGVVLVGTVAVIVRVLVHTRGTRESDEDTDSDVEVLPLRSSSEWEDEAARCRAAGDHRAEVRAWFRATTSALADRGLLPTTPGRTARELGRDVEERAPAASPLFGELGVLFEAVWYGGATAGADDGDRAADLSRRTLAAAPRRARTTASDAPNGDRSGPSTLGEPGADR